MNTNDEIEKVAREIANLKGSFYHREEMTDVAQWHLAKLSEVENEHEEIHNEATIFMEKIQSENKSLQSQNLRMRQALKFITRIENLTHGCDWEEIETARRIAQEALKTP